MKRLSLLLLFCLVVTLPACIKSHTQKCVDWKSTYLIIQTRDSTSRPFSGFVCSRYKKGDNFATPHYTDTILYSVFSSHVALVTNDFSTNFYKYDWIITVLPIGKEYRIKDITSYQHSEKVDDEMYTEGNRCRNGFSFLVSDSLYVVASEKAAFSMPGSQYLFVHY